MTRLKSSCRQNKEKAESESGSVKARQQAIVLDAIKVQLHVSRRNKGICDEANDYPLSPDGAGWMDIRGSSANPLPEIQSGVQKPSRRRRFQVWRVTERPAGRQHPEPQLHESFGDAGAVLRGLPHSVRDQKR